MLEMNDNYENELVSRLLAAQSIVSNLYARDTSVRFMPEYHQVVQRLDMYNRTKAKGLDTSHSIELYINAALELDELIAERDTIEAMMIDAAALNIFHKVK